MAAAVARLRPSASARADAGRLLEAILERNSAWLLAHGEEELDATLATRFESAVARRAAGFPLAYILGAWWFFGRRFEITRDVLVPRPETEQLVELAIAFLRLQPEPAVFWDVGTGSGALAITLACELANARGVASDTSAAALAVAERNAADQNVSERLTFVEADLASDAVAARAPFACIVANLPYVPTRELPMPPDPTSFEPRAALDGGLDGLALYRRLLAAAPRLLAPRAAMFLEAGPGTVPLLAELAREIFGSAAIEIHADYAAQARVVSVNVGHLE